MNYPVLAEQFFHDLRPSAAFFAQWRDHGHWGPELLPIYEWDGLLFVGTSSELPVAAKPNWCVVKADADQLTRLWQELNGEVPLNAKTPLQDLMVKQHEESSIEIVTNTEAVPLAAAPSKAPSLESLTEAGGPPPLPVPEFIQEESTPTPQPVTAAALDQNTVAKPPAPEDPAWAEFWAQISPPYQGAMLLLVQDQMAIPWKWTSSLNGKAEPLSLQTPSPFRIVGRTLKSFHGPVSPSEVGNIFFKEWNQGKAPGTLTITPIIQRDHLIAMLLSWGTPEANTKENLVHFENLAQKVGKIINARPDILRVA